MQVSRNELAAVFAALGVKAAGWTAAQMTKKVNAAGGIGGYRDKGHRFADRAAADLFKRIDDAQDAGALIRVADGPASGAEKAAPRPAKADKPKAKPAPKPAAKGKPGRPPGKTTPPAKSDPWYWRPDGRPTADAPLSVWREYRVKHPATMTDGTLVRAVYDALVRAGTAGPGGTPAPVTRDQLVAHLSALHPDRDAAKMGTNLSNLIPTRFRNVYRVFVWTGTTAGDARRGYYIVDGGRKPQPKEGGKSR